MEESPYILSEEVVVEPLEMNCLPFRSYETLGKKQPLSENQCFGIQDSKHPVFVKNMVSHVQNPFFILRKTRNLPVKDHILVAKTLHAVSKFWMVLVGKVCYTESQVGSGLE